MTAQEVADKWKDMVEGLVDDNDVIAELYHDDVVHIERGDGMEIIGVQAKKEFAAKWEQMVGLKKVISVTINNMIVVGDSIAMDFSSEMVLELGSETMNELVLLKVADGKIVREEYWYPAE